SLSFLASIGLFRPFQLFDDLVQRVEAGGPELVVSLDLGRLFFEAALAEPAGAYAPDLLRGDEAGLLQDIDVLLHAREGQVKFVGEVRDGSVCTAELLEDAATRRIGERGERGIEVGIWILNHMVQYLPWEFEL